MNSYACPFSTASLQVHLSDIGKGIVIVVPGGGYAWRSDREKQPVANVFFAAGYHVAILDYSVGDHLGTLPVKELSWAVQTIKDTVDASLPVITCGFSAGGHLCATLGVHAKKLGLVRQDLMVLCYPVITAGKYAHKESFERLGDTPSQEFFSLEEHVSEDTPPTFLWHTASDTSVPVQNTLLFANKLALYHIPFELHIYPKGDHGLSLATEEVAQPEKNRYPDAHVATWVSLCIAWLEIMTKR